MSSQQGHHRPNGNDLLCRIAGLDLLLQLPLHMDTAALLPSFLPFVLEGSDADPAIVVEIKAASLQENSYGQRLELLSDQSETWVDHYAFYRLEAGFETRVGAAEEDCLVLMYSDTRFQRSTIFVEEHAVEFLQSVLPWMLMVAYGQGAIFFDRLLIHSSVIGLDAQGFGFLGKSGTGKSTHSRMWLGAIEGAELINDDNPILSVDEENNVIIYGSPWSGKTSCYKNTSRRLKALVRLQQAKWNAFEWLTGAEAFTSVLPSCTAIRWDHAFYSRMLNTLERVVNRVPVAKLYCRPDHEAAQLCYEKIKLKSD